MSSAVRLAIILIGVAAIVSGVYGGYQNYERGQHAALIQSKQEALQTRIDALRSEMQTPTSDPAEIKARQERLSGLQKDLDSLKKEVGSPSRN
jgi:uncharacterized protein HemX